MISAIASMPLARLLRSHPREAIALALLASAGLAAVPWIASANVPEARATVAAVQAVPKPEPMLLRPVAPATAEQINAAIPAVGPGAAARPFDGNFRTAEEREKALQCLTSAIYYEAGAEPVDGQRAVAQVVLNRARHPAFPASVCGVVYQGFERDTGCQFTFTCDGSLARAPARWAWERSRKVAEAALAGFVHAPVGNATHYHTNWVVPYWAASLVKSAVVGSHIFYRWSGGWGLPPAFRQRPAGIEPVGAALQAAALARGRKPQQPAVEQAIAADPLLALAEQETPGSVAVEGERIALRIGSPRGPQVNIVQPKPLEQREGSTDNLRWAISGEAEETADQQTPLGKPADAPAGESPAE